MGKREIAGRLRAGYARPLQLCLAARRDGALLRPRRVPAVAFCTKGCDLVLCALHYAFCNLFVTITDCAPKTTGYANFVPQSPFSATIRSEQRQGPKAPPKFKEEKNAKEKTHTTANCRPYSAHRYSGCAGSCHGSAVVCSQRHSA